MDFYEDDDYEEEYESEEEMPYDHEDDQWLEDRCQALYELYQRVIEQHQRAFGHLYIPDVMNSLTPEMFVRHYLTH